MRSSYRHLLLILIVALSASSARFVGTHGQARTAQRAAVQESSAVAAIVKAQKANLRDSPSRAAHIASTVSRGDLLSLLNPEPTGPWYRVRDSGSRVEGWIHGNTIALLRSSEAAASSTETQRPRRTTTPTSGRSYINVDGVRVPSPVFTDKKPVGATARCRDGSYSFSRHRRGTCSYHGGVAEWF